jgi:acyl-CoA dehydrogenase
MTEDISAIVFDTASRLFRDHVDHALLSAAEAGEFSWRLWHAAEEAGVPLAMIPEDAGGIGLEGVAAANLVRLAAYHAVPLPLAETMLASRISAEATLPVPSGPLSIVVANDGTGLTLRRAGGRWHLSGTTKCVPWGRFIKAVVVIAEVSGQSFATIAETAGAKVEGGVNLAMEPRDTLTFDSEISEEMIAQTTTGAKQVKLMGAASRSLAIAGALDRVLEMTVGYVGERVQFGRPLSKFQAIQQSLAVVASQVAAADGAASLAAEALAGSLSATRIAAAKVRCGEAAGSVAGIAHQLHGAIGFSNEHMLHFFTKRLWSWRDEFGGETEWSRALGAKILILGPETLWPSITAA